MGPLRSAQLFAVFSFMVAFHGAVGLVTGRFGVGRGRRYLSVEGTPGYIVSAACCAVAVVLAVLALRYFKAALREKPYRVDYP